MNAEVEHELARAHAAFHWCATVRQCVMSGMLRAHGEDARRGLLNILAVAHAAAEVWLSGERVTAAAVARLLGWNAPHSALAVGELLRPLQDGPSPQLVTADGQPNIRVSEGQQIMTSLEWQDCLNNPIRWEGRCKVSSAVAHAWVCADGGRWDIGARVEQRGDETDWHVALNPWPAETVDMDRAIRTIKTIVEALCQVPS